MTIETDAGGISVQAALPPRPRPYKKNKTNSNIPKYPCEAPFRAMEIMNPNVKFDDIDVIVSRNSLRKLLDFCAGRSLDSFRIEMFGAGRNTLILEIHERNLRDMEHGALPRRAGLGHAFEHAVTLTTSPPGEEISTSHQRMIRYKLGNLMCAVRFEVDAMYYGGEESNETPSTLSGDDDHIAGLADAFHALNMQQPPVTAPQKSHRTVQAVLGGILDPHCHAAEIKAAVKQRRKGIHVHMPQLWFGRTPWLIRGYHTTGTFDKIDIDHVTGEPFAEWESRDANQLALRKLSGLLSRLRDIMMRERRKGKLAAAALVYEKESRGKGLQVFSANLNRKALPDDVLDRFWSREV